MWRSDAQVAVRTGKLRAAQTPRLDVALGELLAGIDSGTVRTRGRRPFKPSTRRAVEQNYRLRVAEHFGANGYRTFAWSSNPTLGEHTNALQGFQTVKYSYSPDVLDRYVGVYSIPGAPAKARITREGSTLFFQPPGESSAVALEATAEDTFQIEGAAVFTFDAAKNQMTIKRRGGERVFTKEQ